MNLYIVVEGRRTEKKVYPAWLNILLPELTRVDWPDEVSVESYYLFNGNGFPSLLHNHLANSIEEINELGTFDYLVLVMDVDETSIEFRKQEVLGFIDEQNLSLPDTTELIIIPQDKCLETWFLGNRNVFKSNPNRTDLIEYVRFYNVKQNDPERMGVFDGFNTHAQFHSEYCKEFLRERNIRYTKVNPQGVTEETYLNELIKRSVETEHLSSFKSFIEFCDKLKEKLKNTTANNS